MSHEVQLSPAASNSPTATLPSRPSRARAPRRRQGAAELLRPGQAPSAVTPHEPGLGDHFSPRRRFRPSRDRHGGILTVTPRSRHPPAEPARPGRDLPAKLATADFLALLDERERQVVVLLRSGYTKVGDVADILGYKNHTRCPSNWRGSARRPQPTSGSPSAAPLSQMRSVKGTITARHGCQQHTLCLRTTEFRAGSSPSRSVSQCCSTSA